MKAISLWQPWALLWLLSDPDVKVFETRSWPTSHRGPLLVHAGKKRSGEVRDGLQSPAFAHVLETHRLTMKAFEFGSIETLEFGAIIGQVELVACTQMRDMPAPSESELTWGNWSPERFAWQRGPKPTIFKTPIPFRGAQGIFNVPASVLSGARA